MLDRKDALATILKQCGESFAANGFQTRVPDGPEKGAAPVFTADDGNYIEIYKNDLTVRIVSHDNLLDITESDNEGEFTKNSSNLLDLDTFEERDMKSLCNEVADTITSSYGKKSVKKNMKKAPVPVSKTAAKNGASYDANTLANRLTAVYPELKEPYKENFQKYDEFLAEDFFVNHANKCIMETIRGNDTQKLKKLFKILSDIYENGSNETQDVVIVTILGEIDNDRELLKKCREYITDEDFYDTLVAVNKYLASSAGKKAKAKLLNPPKYKPKKEQKGGLMNSLMGAQPPMQ